MVLLSKKEYDDLVQRASHVEGQVELRLAEEKRKILLALREGLREAGRNPLVLPYERLQQLVDELLR